MSTEVAMAVQDEGTRDIVGRPAPRFFAAVPTSMQEAMEMAKLIANSNLVPKAFQGKPGDVLVAMMWGAELEIAPFQALQNIAVINGRPTVWGDLVVALVQRSGKLEYLVRDWDETNQIASVKIKRKGFPESVSTFSMQDAKRAGLAGKDTYRQYPQRMCMWRALTFAIRNEFSDVLKGMAVAEEAMDYQETVTTTAKPIAAPKPLAQLVEGFLAPPPQEKPRQPAGDEDQRGPSGESPSEVVRITGAVVQSTGKTAKNKPWTLFKVSLEDGRDLNTFSESIYEAAHEALESGAPVIIATEPGKKPGNFMVTRIEPADLVAPEGEAE